MMTSSLQPWKVLNLPKVWCSGIGKLENMTQQIRCFVAIEIPMTIQNQLAQIQTILRKQIQRASWVKPGNIHLTLKFLGDVNPDDIESIGQTTEQAAAHHSPFSLRMGGVGAFPSLARPRAIWSGVKVGEEQVSALAQDINQALSRCGFPPDDKKFNSHLTIARLKRRVDLRPFVNLYRQYDEIDDGAMTVHEISLIQSQLHPKGAVYTTLQSYALTR